jgi:phosphatidylserine/phosphatidylglycerophosphate/cardiolipin synthase-like enzyme
MDHKLIAAITLQKLTNAAKRGCATVLIIDDLNYYASQKGIKALKEAGGIVIRNNPFEKAYEHVLNGRYQKFFNRNHQKVMLVDQHVFCGSLNVADPYSGARYGDGTFRDLNIILRNQDARSIRNFFLELLIQNDKLFPHQFKIEEIIQTFAELDLKYNSMTFEN